MAMSMVLPGIVRMELVTPSIVMCSVFVNMLGVGTGVEAASRARI